VKRIIAALTVASACWVQGVEARAGQVQTRAENPRLPREALADLGVSFSEDSFVSCAARGDARAVELFLAAGMSPNARNNDGFTPLMWAAGQGHMEIVRTLLTKVRRSIPKAGTAPRP